MPKKETIDYPYLRAWGQSMGNSTDYITERLAQARADDAPRDVIFHRDTPSDDGRCEYVAASGRVWRRYDHWNMPPMTRAHMASYLTRYGVDPASEADPTPQWHWLEVAQVAWRGWVLHRTGVVLGRVARIVREHDDAHPHGSVIWMPLTADGQLIGESRPDPASARTAVEDFARVAEGGLVPRVCHRTLPQGSCTRDEESSR
jgi:hypothetical protein